MSGKISIVSLMPRNIKHAFSSPDEGTEIGHFLSMQVVQNFVLFVELYFVLANLLFILFE